MERSILSIIAETINHMYLNMNVLSKGKHLKDV